MMERLLIFLTLIGIGQNTYIRASVIRVGKDELYQNIIEAINQASAYDTVKVYSGVYHEANIVIDKPLSVIGINRPIVEPGDEKAGVFLIKSDSVTLEGFIIKNVPVSYMNELAAIKSVHSKHGIIRDNEIKNCFFGIYLEYAQAYTIEHNQILGEAFDEASAGNAIHVWKGQHIEIAYNTTTSHRDGIYFEFVDQSSIHHNLSFQNLRYGLHFMFSNYDHYRLNEFTENGAGVAVMFSNNIIMERNLFQNNWGGASYGLLLKEISDGEISSNTFDQNTIGILAEGLNRFRITRNTFSSNGTAIDIKGNCLGNKIQNNNFLSNTFDVVTNSRQSNNEFDNNYWSSYRGYDLDRDGIGDVPYRPVNLFSIITEVIPSAAIMMHSLIANLFNLSERIFPTLIPEELMDERPRMKPFVYDSD